MEESLWRKVEKHDRDLYEGNGKDNPSLTTRMALNEGDIEDVKTTVNEIKSDSKATRNMVIGLILAVIGQIVVQLISKHW